MSAKSDPRVERADAKYAYRRSLKAHETLPAIAVGVVVGAAAFYIVSLFLQRTPLVPPTTPAPRTPLASRKGAVRKGAVEPRPSRLARTLGG